MSLIDPRTQQFRGVDDELAYLEQRIEAGQLDASRLLVAAFCDHSASLKFMAKYPVSWTTEQMAGVLQWAPQAVMGLLQQGFPPAFWEGVPMWDPIAVSRWVVEQAPPGESRPAAILLKMVHAYGREWSGLAAAGALRSAMAWLALLNTTSRRWAKQALEDVDAFLESPPQFAHGVINGAASALYHELDGVRLRWHCDRAALPLLRALATNSVVDLLEVLSHVMRALQESGLPFESREHAEIELTWAMAQAVCERAVGYRCLPFRRRLPLPERFRVVKDTGHTNDGFGVYDEETTFHILDWQEKRSVLSVAGEPPRPVGEEGWKSVHNGVRRIVIAPDGHTATLYYSQTGERVVQLVNPDGSVG